MPLRPSIRKLLYPSVRPSVHTEKCGYRLTDLHHLLCLKVKYKNNVIFGENLTRH